MVKPTISIYRGGNQSWIPNWNLSSPSNPDITNFLMGFELRDAGNYAIGEYDITLKNTTSNLVGLFTNSSYLTCIGVSEYFKIMMDNGNVSKIVYGKFGSWDASETGSPPKEVTFHGKDLREELIHRTISVDYNQSNSPTNFSDAIVHMFNYPDDAPTGTHPLDFVINISGTGLNQVLPESNYANQHPSIFNALSEGLQTLGYEQSILINANNSKVFQVFPSGAITHSPVIYIQNGITNLADNNALGLKYKCDYDEVANIVGVFGDTIKYLPARIDEWTDNTVWNASAWNASDGDRPVILNFSDTSVHFETTMYDSEILGFNTSCIIEVFRGEFLGDNITAGVTLTFPSYSQSSRLRLDSLNAKYLKFQATCISGSQCPITIKVRMQDGTGSVIENNDVVTGVFGWYVEGGDQRVYIDNPYSLKWYELYVNASNRRISGTEKPNQDWFYVNDTNFSFDDIKSITWYSNANTSMIGFLIDNVVVSIDFPLNTRIASDLLPLAFNQSSINFLGRRFKPLIDDRIKTISDALVYQSSELVKLVHPIKRVQVNLDYSFLHIEPSKTVTLDSPAYGVDDDPPILDNPWRVLEARHSWRSGDEYRIIADIVYPSTPSSPGQDITNLRSASFNEEDQVASLLESLYKKYSTQGKIGGTSVIVFPVGGPYATYPITENGIADGSITTDKLGNIAITANNIQDFTITANKIANATITANQIANYTITTTQIGNYAFTNANIANFTITNANIANYTITAQNIGNYVVTASQIANYTVTANQLANYTVTAGQITNYTVTALQLANATITGLQIANFTIESVNIGNGAILAVNIGNGVVTTYKLDDYSVTAVKIANTTITASQISNFTITASQIANYTISATQIANYTVTATQIANYTINAINIANYVITSLQMANLTINAQQIENATITGLKIANSTIESVNIGNQTILAVNIANGTITGTQIENYSITAVKISNYAITASQITNLTITAGQIANLTITASQMGNDAVIERIVANNAITSDKIIANAIVTEKIATSAVTADQIATNAITADKILVNAITANKILANAITTDKIIANAITVDKISYNAVTTNQILANAITTDKIIANAITSALIATDAVISNKIVANAIVTNKIATDAVTANQIAANSIVANKILAGAVTTDKILSKSITSEKLLIGSVVNVLDNPDFETGTISGWSDTGSGTVSVQEAFRIAGNYTLRMDIATNWNSVYQERAAYPGETYYLSAFVDEPEVGFPSQPCRLFISAYDKNNSLIDQAYVTENPQTGVGARAISVTYTMPALTTKVRVSLVVYQGGGGASGFWGFDNVFFNKQTGTVEIENGAITAQKISVTSLSAITANLGTINAGTITGATVNIVGGSYQGELLQFYSGATYHGGIWAGGGYLYINPMDLYSLVLGTVTTKNIAMYSYEGVLCGDGSGNGGISILSATTDRSALGCDGNYFFALTGYRIGIATDENDSYDVMPRSGYVNTATIWVGANSLDADVTIVLRRRTTAGTTADFGDSLTILTTDANKSLTWTPDAEIDQGESIELHLDTNPASSGTIVIQSVSISYG